MWSAPNLSKNYLFICLTVPSLVVTQRIFVATCSILFFFLVAAVQTLGCSIWDLVAWPGIWSQAPWSLSHWTTREDPAPFLDLLTFSPPPSLHISLTGLFAILQTPSTVHSPGLCSWRSLCLDHSSQISVWLALHFLWLPAPFDLLSEVLPDHPTHLAYPSSPVAHYSALFLSVALIMISHAIHLTHCFYLLLECGLHEGRDLIPGA